jgi:hypothetical protein
MTSVVIEERAGCCCDDWKPGSAAHGGTRPRAVGDGLRKSGIGSPNAGAGGGDGSECEARSVERRSRAFALRRWPGMNYSFESAECRQRAFGQPEVKRSSGRASEQWHGKGCETAKVTGGAKSVHAASARAPSTQ